MIGETPTTRQYPRTTGEAFKDANYADPIDRPQTENGPGGWALAVAIGFVGAWFFVEWLSH